MILMHLYNIYRVPADPRPSAHLPRLADSLARFIEVAQATFILHTRPPKFTISHLRFWSEWKAVRGLRASNRQTAAVRVEKMRYGF